MDKNSKDTKHTRHIDRIINGVINGEECNLYKKVWCVVGMQMAEIATKNFREDEFNHRLGYDMVRLDNLQNTCTRGVIGFRIF